MTIIMAKFIVSTVLGFAFGFVSLRGGAENPLGPVWFGAFVLSVVAFVAAALIFVFGQELPWASFGLIEWLFIVMDIGYLLGGITAVMIDQR